MLFLLVLLVVSVVVECCCSLLEVVGQPNNKHIKKDNGDFYPTTLATLGARN